MFVKLLSFLSFNPDDFVRLNSAECVYYREKVRGITVDVGLHQGKKRTKNRRVRTGLVVGETKDEENP